jgi:ribosomal protein S8
LISQLKLGFAKKSFYFTVFLTKQILNLLLIFKKLNIIRRFQITNTKTCRIFPTYNKFLIPTSSIKNYSRLKRPIYLKLTALKLLNLSLNHSTFIIETSKGLLTSIEAVKLKLGGLLVCKIN